VVKGKGEQIDLETGEIGVHSTPLVVKDVIVIGSAMREGATVSTHNNTKGLVARVRRAHRQGAVDVQHDSEPGEFGNDSWENESWATNGNVGVWTQITVDEEPGSSTCRSRRRRRTSTAAIGPATTCSPNRCRRRSEDRPAQVVTSSSRTIRCGTSTCRPRRSSPT
jgi:hypothetical protein